MSAEPSLTPANAAVICEPTPDIHDAGGEPAVKMTLHVDADGQATDGAWWPHSHDLAEVGRFVNALSADVGEVSRITLNPADWTTHPRVLDLGSRDLRIDWFEAAPRDALSARRGYAPRLPIVVHPAAECGTP